MHRRFASESSSTNYKRPNSFVLQQSSQKSQIPVVPAHFRYIVPEFERKNAKTYIEGYLLKLDDLLGDGSRATDITYSKIYAQLTGTVLSTWQTTPTGRDDPIDQKDPSAPTFINIADARLSFVVQSHAIALSTAGKNRYLIRAPQDDAALLLRWLIALRLAIYERTRMQEMYTALLFKRFCSVELMDANTRDERYAGHVDARITGSDFAMSSWTRLWCTVVNQSSKKLFRRRSLNSFPAQNDSVQEIRFYQDKKDKVPLVAFSHVFVAFALYPEHASLIETGGMVKIQGKLASATLGVSHNREGSALIIPVLHAHKRRPSSSSTTPFTLSPSGPPSITAEPCDLLYQILKVLVAVYDTFSLYGRPGRLILNAKHNDALGLNGGNNDLRVQDLDSERFTNAVGEAEWRKVFTEQSVALAHLESRREISTPSSSINTTTPVRSLTSTPRSSATSFPLVPPFEPETNDQLNVVRLTTGRLPQTKTRTGHERRVASESSILPPRPRYESIEEKYGEEEEPIAWEIRRTIFPSVPSSYHTRERVRNSALQKQNFNPANHQHQSILASIRTVEQFDGMSNHSYNTYGGRSTQSEMALQERSVGPMTTAHQIYPVSQIYPDLHVDTMRPHPSYTLVDEPMSAVTSVADTSSYSPIVQPTPQRPQTSYVGSSWVDFSNLDPPSFESSQVTAPMHNQIQQNLVDTQMSPMPGKRLLHDFSIQEPNSNASVRQGYVGLRPDIGRNFSSKSCESEYTTYSAEVDDNVLNMIGEFGAATNNNTKNGIGHDNGRAYEKDYRDVLANNRSTVDYEGSMYSGYQPTDALDESNRVNADHTTAPHESPREKAVRLLDISRPPTTAPLEPKRNSAPQAEFDLDELKKTEKLGMEDLQLGKIIA